MNLIMVAILDGYNMVNGVKPNYGAYSYKLNDGDTIKWYYTTDYTKD